MAKDDFIAQRPTPSVRPSAVQPMRPPAPIKPAVAQKPMAANQPRGLGVGMTAVQPMQRPAVRPAAANIVAPRPAANPYQYNGGQARAVGDPVRPRGNPHVQPMTPPPSGNPHVQPMLPPARPMGDPVMRPAIAQRPPPGRPAPLVPGTPDRQSDPLPRPGNPHVEPMRPPLTPGRPAPLVPGTPGRNSDPLPAGDPVRRGDPLVAQRPLPYRRGR